MVQVVGIRRDRRSAVLTMTVLAAAASITLAGCTSGGSDGKKDTKGSRVANAGSGSSAPSSSAAPVVEAAQITTTPTGGEQRISPTVPVSVSIAHGKLTSVTLVNPAGKKVKGALAADSTSWKSSEPLGYDRTYRLTAVGENADGKQVTKKSTLVTYAPKTLTHPTITDVYGSNIGKGKTFGVGMIVRVQFDEGVDKAAAERTLSVTTSPKVTGGWYWQDDQNAYWRPEKYYEPGTKVSVKADVYGKKVGKGLYGQDDASASFTIGEKRVAIADPKTHMVNVYINDKLRKRMPTSMGKGGYEPGIPSINYWTMHGTYTVLTHENPATMTSGSYGVPKSSPNYYPPEKIYWATKISTDGIYLHELNTTIWAQGHQNVSHGCLNLKTSNAKWYFNHSRVGDVVQVKKGLGNPKIQFGQGGQWSVSWSDWQKGSALR